MHFRKIQKPPPNEYPFYSNIYMDLMPDDGLVLKHLWGNFLAIKKLITSLPEEKLQFKYAADKWNIKEILLHLIDDERIYTYRALAWARNDQTPLPGFEQDDYAQHSAANERSLDSIFEEYESVRKATISLFQYLPEEALLRSGVCEGHRRTVRAMAYHIAGHERHHLKMIRERYLG